MPRINLYFKPIPRKTVLGQGHILAPPQLRIYTQLWLGSELELQKAIGLKPAIVDIGVPLSIFPVGWLTILEKSVIPEHRALPNQDLPIGKAIGCTYLVKYARLDATPVDEVTGDQLLPSLVFAAICVTRIDAAETRNEIPDKDGLKEIVIGLNGGILEGRYLIVSPNEDKTQQVAWLQDEKPN